MRFQKRSIQQFYENGVHAKSVPAELRKIVHRKLTYLEAATSLDALRVPPSNHLEKLKGDLEGFYSIRVNSEYRIIFRWTDEGADNVDVVDYH